MDDTSHTSDDAGTERTVDAVVLGLGPGGEHVGGALASAGLSVIGIEAELVGGECPYWGCVPTKMMVRAADLLAEARRVPAMAGSSTTTPDWAPVAARVRDEATANWDDTSAVERFEGRGGTLVRGRGRLVSRDTVEVDGQRFRATRALVVTTGTTTAVPPIPGLDGTPYWTNRDAVAVEELPSSLAILGAGAIGCEFAQIFARFGVEVTVVEAAEHLLPIEEPEVGQLLAQVFRDDGIAVHTGASAEHVAFESRGGDQAGGTFTLTLEGGRTITADRLLVATGRRVDLQAIGADVLGVDADERSLPVDEHLRVRDGVWAIGDVTGLGAFTHVALHQARIAVADILGEPHRPFDRRAVPRVTFTDPEVGSVGLTTSGARDAGIDVVTATVDVASTARGWMHQEGNSGLIHLVVDRTRQVLVGATAMGPNGGEVLGLLTLAVHSATPLDELRSMIYAYPTFHGGIADALRKLR